MKKTNRVIITPVMETLPACRAKTFYYINGVLVFETTPPSPMDYIASGKFYRRELKKRGFTNIQWKWKPRNNCYAYHELSAIPPTDFTIPNGVQSS